MSSTKRGSVREVSDYYVTPPWLVNEFMEAFQVVQPKLFSDLRAGNALVLDPCAGGDSVNGMAYPEGLARQGVEPFAIATLDVREDSRAECIGDYLATHAARDYDLIITNPPFALSLPIIQKALREVRLGGWVVMLLRLNFFGSAKRLPFFREHMPRYTFVHSKRPSFGASAVTAKATTDSIEYAHFCWQNGYTAKSSTLYLLGEGQALDQPLHLAEAA